MTIPTSSAVSGPARCPACQTDLRTGARFCHRCGAAAGVAHQSAAGNERNAWIAAGAVVLASLVGIAFVLIRPSPPARPDMASAGAPTALTGRAPDISAMSPREGFDRLYNRVMTAAEQGDTATVVRLTDHAFAAYTQLGSADADARYHAAMLHAQVGQLQEARAIADTILGGDQRDLLGLLILGTVAELQQNGPALAEARKRFLAAWPARDQKRADYLDHQRVLEDFRKAAEAAR